MAEMSRPRDPEQGDGARGGSLPVREQLEIRRMFVDEIAQEMLPFLDFPEDNNQVMRAFSALAQNLKPVTDGYAEYISRELLNEALEQILVEFVTREKFRFTSVLLSAVPRMQDAREQGDVFNRASEYALETRLKYGELAEFYSHARIINPEFFHTQKFRKALYARVESELKEGSVMSLKRLNGLVHHLEHDPHVPGDIRLKMISEYRDTAREALRKSIGRQNTRTLEDMFFLSETLEEPDVQMALSAVIEECFDNGNLLQVQTLLDQYPLEKVYREQLRDKAHFAVRMEKAKIAAGYYESLPESQVTMQYREPINSIVEEFSLPLMLRESFPHERAA